MPLFLLRDRRHGRLSTECLDVLDDFLLWLGLMKSILNVSGLSTFSTAKQLVLLIRRKFYQPKQSKQERGTKLAMFSKLIALVSGTKK